MVFSTRYPKDQIETTGRSSISPLKPRKSEEHDEDIISLGNEDDTTVTNASPTKRMRRKIFN